MNYSDEKKSVNISDLNSNYEIEPEQPPVMSVQECQSPYI